MFHFPGSLHLAMDSRMDGTKAFLSRFPHSDICGLSDICSSPQLFAACHVFHRLPVPRHPPCALLLRKEVIQPHLPIRLPCYDFTPVIRPAFGCSLLSVGSQTSGISDSHGVTGGVYKTRERIHRNILICDY